MPCPPYFIRVPAVPCMVQGGGPGLGAHGMLRLGAGGDVVWLEYSTCMCVVPQGGKDGEEAGRRQLPLQDTPLLPHCETLSRRDSRLSRWRASQ